MRFYLDSMLTRVYISLDREPTWKFARPDGASTRHRCLHMYARLAPDQGNPARECDLVPVYEAMFTCYCREIKAAEAHQYDPGLVEYLFRLKACPLLPRLQALLSPGAQLHLVDCGPGPHGQIFDVYLVPASKTKLVYLNPLLTGLFPTCEIDGAARILVPFPEAIHGGRLLAQALAARVWGEREIAPGFVFEVVY